MREIILGCIQGFTEFLPVSSSGHLALVQHFYPGFDETDLLLDILLHLGTLGVVLIYYRQEIAAICRAAFSYIWPSFAKSPVASASAEDQGTAQRLLARRMVSLIIIGSVPTAMIGVVFKSVIKQSFSSLPAVGIALLITGIALYLADHATISRTRTTLSYKDALIIGTVQGIAIFPGISRSGSTISAAILLGIERKIAAKYSFLLSIPAILGAIILEGKDLAALTQTPQLIPYLLGTLAAFITGYFAITALIKVVLKRKLSWFAIYCWVIGGGTLVYSFLR